jgi:hypothetical protein
MAKSVVKPELGRLIDDTTGREMEVSDVVDASREYTAAVRRQAADMMLAFDDGKVVSAEEILFGDK